MDVQLQPLARSPEALTSYIDINFRRIRDALARLGRVEQLSTEVTGSLLVDTGIPVVKNVAVSLGEQPAAAAAYVTATLDPDDSRNVLISVWKSDFSASVVATTINMIAIGDEPSRPT